MLAGTHWRGPLLTAAPFSSYPEVGWQDDMMLGAGLAEYELARALGQQQVSGLAINRAGLPVMAYEYTALAGPGGISGWAQHWLDAIFGANAWSVSFIVGDGSVFPHCPHNQIANLAGPLAGWPPVLAGATVEGPNAFASHGAVTGMRHCADTAPGGVPYSAFSGHGAVFADNVQSYSTVEPGIDLTVLTPLAFAWQVAAAHGTVPPP